MALLNKWQVEVFFFFTKFIKTDCLVAVTTFDFDNMTGIKVLEAFGIQPKGKAERKVAKALRIWRKESGETAETDPQIKEADDVSSRKPWPLSAVTDCHYCTVSITVVTCVTLFHNVYLLLNIWVNGSRKKKLCALNVTSLGRLVHCNVWSRNLKSMSSSFKNKGNIKVDI